MDKILPNIKDDMKFIKGVVFQTIKKNNFINKKWKKQQYDYQQDFFSSGCLGYTKALKSFDKARGIDFRAYAYCRIRGQVLDDFRSLFGDKRTKTKRPIYINGLNNEFIQNLSLDTDNEISETEFKKLIDTLNLKKQEKEVLWLRFQGYSLTEISKLYNKTVSWASQMCSKTQIKLKKILCFDSQSHM